MNIETQNGYVFSIFGKNIIYSPRKIRAIIIVENFISI